MSRPTRPHADIQALVSEGGEIPGAGAEGSARHEGRAADDVHHDSVAYLVYMPKGRGVGISARIEDEAERLRLRDARPVPAQR
jgi:hypothetical protein